jgi:hypothetical protein
LSVGFGSQLVLSTYNNFNNNTHRDAILIAIFNSLTSIYAGLVVFCILGYLGHITDKDVKEVVRDGIKGGGMNQFVTGSILKYLHWVRVISWSISCMKYEGSNASLSATIRKHDVSTVQIIDILRCTMDSKSYTKPSTYSSK